MPAGQSEALQLQNNGTVRIGLLVVVQDRYEGGNMGYHVYESGDRIAAHTPNADIWILFPNDSVEVEERINGDMQKFCITSRNGEAEVRQTDIYLAQAHGGVPYADSLAAAKPG